MCLSLGVLTLASCGDNGDDHDDADMVKHCGGLAGGACGEDEYCDYAGGSCGAGDDQGTCMPRPAICEKVLHEVCGCDGVTYPNECQANEMGQDISNDTSRCPAP